MKIFLLFIIFFCSFAFSDEKNTDCMVENSPIKGGVEELLASAIQQYHLVVPEAKNHPEKTAKFFENILGYETLKKEIIEAYLDRYSEYELAQANKYCTLTYLLVAQPNGVSDRDINWYRKFTKSNLMKKYNRVETEVEDLISSTIPARAAEAFSRLKSMYQ